MSDDTTWQAEEIWRLHEEIRFLKASGGRSLRDHFAGQALANCALCTGEARDWQIKAWFGERGGITREEIVAKQAYALADAMLKARTPPSTDGE